MKIAILSRENQNYTTGRLAEAIKAQGHEPLLIDYSRCYVDIEPNRPAVHYDGRPLEGIDIVVPRIGASITSYGAAVIRQFEMMRVYASVSSLALVRSRDKLRALQLLARAGIGIPRTVFARQKADTSDLIDMVGGAPVVIKLLASTQGRGVVLGETRKAASSIIEAFYELGTNILIQEFIEEAHGSDIRIIVAGENVVGAMMRQGQEGDFRSNLHRGGKAQPVELTTKEKNIAIKSAQTLGLKVAGVDIVRSKRGPLVLEVNSSPGLEGLEKVVGKHAAEDIIDFIVKQASGKRRRDRIGA